MSELQQQNINDIINENNSISKQQDNTFLIVDSNQPPTPLPNQQQLNGNNSDDINFELPSSAKVIHSKITGSTIILVGSIHIHQSSSDEVSEVIRKWRPDTVFIELCQSRVGVVMDQQPKKVEIHKKDDDIINIRQNRFKRFGKVFQKNNDDFEQEEEDDYRDNTFLEDTTTNTNPFDDIDVNDMTQEDNEIYTSEEQEEEEEEEEEEDGFDENDTFYNEEEDEIYFYGDDENESDSESSYLKNNSCVSPVISNPHYFDRQNNPDTEADDEKSNPPSQYHSLSSTPYTTTPPTPVGEEVTDNVSFQDMINIIKANGLSGILHVLMGELIRKAGKKSNVGPGAEFLTAFVEAKKIGARVVLGDRLIEITLQRVWNSLTRWEKMKFVFYLLWASLSDVTKEDIDAMRNSSEELINQLLNEFREKFPSVIQTIVTERDQYMAANLRVCQGKKIVAVVGKGHIPGILREWENYNINLKELESVYVNRNRNSNNNNIINDGNHKSKSNTNENSDNNNNNSKDSYFQDMDDHSWITKWASFLLIPMVGISLYFFNKKFNFL
ncbi:hypothetical protein CYY_004896 [Polysphondylium violaceum]|uniref:TraB family protein n=1 Tax=Polysphondylium violaceum TaxID=133409 RepID=A0A8J4V4Q9_9MYCE|nr:hypothetical protein CYY_004896 [Polysphondylium violaceum]